ncbi:MAG: helix-turn-helix transcriptional regulator [Clostridia bacterium]|nr:helix-turn-helix transcriptional regulator [Clostridia bacterium]
MAPFYEKRDKDFFYRDDRGGRTKLGCSPHLHRHVEFAYMIEGYADGYADSGVCRIEAGDFFIAFPNQIHRFVTYGPEKYMLFIVNPDMIPELGALMLGASPASNLLKPAEQPPALRQLLEQLAAVWRQPSEHQELILRGYLLALFGELLPRLSLGQVRSADTQVLRSVIDFCTDNYTRPLSLSTLSDELHISKYYISHLFSNKLGIGFNDYINSLRVSAACRQLRGSECSVTEISESVGFSTLRTFNRAFLRHVGSSPSEYRKNRGGAGYSVSVPI